MESRGLHQSVDSANETSTALAVYVEEQIASLHIRDMFIIITYCILGTPINFAGTMANVVNIFVYVKMGFSETINISLLALSISDLFGLVTLQWLNLCLNPLFMDADIPFNSFEVQYLTAGHPHIVFARITGFITAYINFERCMCVVMPLKVKRFFTPSVTIVVLVTINIAMILCVIPIYLVNGLGWKFDELRNRSLVGLIFRENRFEVEQVAYAIINFNTFLAFGLVTLFTAVLIRKLKSKSKWREGVNSDSKNVTSSIAKERKVIQMVTMISCVFVVCFLPVTANTVGSMIVPGYSVAGSQSNLAHCVIAVGFLAEEINASINIFIYMKMSSKFRATFFRYLLRRPDPAEKDKPVS